MRILVAAIVLTVLPIVTSAHHSRAEYEEGMTELSGTVERVQWLRPHVRLIVAVPNENGATERWNLEGTDIQSLDRAGLPHDLIQVGSAVRIAGNVSTRRASRMFVHNVLLEDGMEIILNNSTDPRWPEARSVVGSRYPLTEFQDEPEPEPPMVVDATGIFRVWQPRMNNIPPDFADDPPFTDIGRADFEAFDPVFDWPVNCNPPGMPWLMTRSDRAPIEFIDQGNVILIRTQVFEQTREVYMDSSRSFEDEPLRRLGYSVGRREDNALVVSTTRIDWPYLSLFGGLEGAPQSAQTTITERFTLSDNETTLIYDVIADDPVNFTEPVAANAYYIYTWHPDLRITPESECGPEFSE